MNIFKDRKYTPELLVPDSDDTPNVTAGAWLKCARCGGIIYRRQLGKYKLCPECKYCFRLTAKERIELFCDEDTFVAMEPCFKGVNPLNYPKYEEKLASASDGTGLDDAVVCGECKINSFAAVLCVMDPFFIMGSMGSAVGENITRAFELALLKKLPVIVFTASGGARMQEGIISLMQMAKVSAAVKKHSDAGLLYISVITDPTMGGVTASFAMESDIVLAEPGAVVGFAGRRVIEQTIKQSLPDDFQTAEFLLEHGFIDKITPRNALKETLNKIFKVHIGQGGGMA